MITQTEVDVLAQYREMKQKTEALSAAARKEMQSKYIVLLNEAAVIQLEFKNCFGCAPELPNTVKAFSLGERKAPEPTEAATNGKKIGGLRRSFNAALKNGDSSRALELVGKLKELGVTVAMPALPDIPAEPPTLEGIV